MLPADRLLLITPMHMSRRRGCLHRGERFQNAVAMTRPMRDDPTIPRLKLEELTFELQFRAPTDHIANRLVFASGQFLVIVRRFLPEPHRDSDARGQILLPHRAAWRMGRA